MVPVVDAADRHLLAVVAVWIVAVALLVPAGAVVLGVALRLFFWALGQ